jgi:hypothetical protein
MTDEQGTGAPATEISPPAKPLNENAFLRLVQRPRIMLVLLAAWAIVGVLTETFTGSGLFFDNHDREVDGALAGRALAWQGIPLALLYLYCARDPMRYQRVFWLALVEQVAAVISALFHWTVTDTYSGESIVIPVIGSSALATLVFLHLFQPRGLEEAPPTASA